MRVHFTVITLAACLALVPAEQADSYRQGWIDYYWTPLRAYFTGS